MFCRQEKGSFTKVQNSIFSKGSMVFVKKSNFYHLCFLGESSQKRSFFDILDKKECFPDQKNEVLKKFKKSKFRKMQFFRLFFKIIEIG